MKHVTRLSLAVVPWLLLVITHRGICVQRVDCQWGPFGDWSECDGCTKLQTRSRAMADFAQFGGNPCDGDRSQTRSCETTKGCPLEDGCGDRFRCGSGKCVSQSLLCNGDVDCEGDGLDERACGGQLYITCWKSALPPNTDLLGLGYDVVTAKWKASVINTNSFGGLCRNTYSGVHNSFYRLPLSTIKYSFVVNVQNDFSDEMYSSKWHYAKDIVNRETVSGTTKGYHNYDFHQTDDRTQTRKLLVLKNDIEIAQFQSNSPQYLIISEEFWKELTKLPSVYDYAAYRKVLERYGTHYLSEGSLGGSFNVIASLNEETERQIDARTNEVNKVDVEGGGIEHIAALKRLNLNDPKRNWEMYSNWADSVRSFPKVTKQKLRYLSELVKEVQCAGVKKLYLRRAIEQYLAESDPCHCRPCSNNGLAVMDGDKCKCICKPGTSGQACEQGTEAEGQQDVIHGSWACWSTWSSCSGGRRSRSRSCSNPLPQNGGQHCIGESTESSDCEDQELQYLRTMEPQCFDHTLPASQRCRTPPALVNGYILDPKETYLVGSRVSYTCADGFYLIGSDLECTADLTWSHRPGTCTHSSCTLESLADDVIADPLQRNYYIGDEVIFSCPAGKQLIGETRATCDSSSNFSPDPANSKCIPVVMAQQVVTPFVQCKPWEKSTRGKCVCKMPYECSSSLEMCATSHVTGKSILLNVCKIRALQCMGKNHTIAENSACKWPERNTTGCANCRMWETCDDQANECRCKDSADCLSPGLNVCVRVGEDEAAATQTMSECEAGLQRCKGETLSVVSTLPCDA